MQFNTKFNKMEEDKNLEQNLDKSDEKLHISDVIVSCPECGCDYTYEVGYGFRECFECLNTWNASTAMISRDR